MIMSEYINTASGSVVSESIYQKGIDSGFFNADEWVEGDSNAVGKKFDLGKPDWSLLPISAIDEVVKVFTLGSQKYGRENWKKVDDGVFRYLSAAYRHLSSYKLYLETGEECYLYDDESGLHHLSHAATNLLFIIWMDQNGHHIFSQNAVPSWWLKKQKDLIAKSLENFLEE